MSKTKITNNSPGLVSIFGLPAMAPGKSVIMSGTPESIGAALGGLTNLGEALILEQASANDTVATAPVDKQRLDAMAGAYGYNAQATVTGAATGNVLGTNHYTPGAGVAAFVAKATVALLGTAGATAGKGGAFELIGSFAVDSSGVITQESTTTTVHSKKDAAFNASTLPAFAIVSTTSLDVAATNGAAGETNKWMVSLVVMPMAS